MLQQCKYLAKITENGRPTLVSPTAGMAKRAAVDHQALQVNKLITHPHFDAFILKICQTKCYNNANALQK